MDTIVARLTAKSGYETQLRNELHKLVDSTKEEAGSRLYTIHEGEHGRFLVYERYADPDALKVHMESSHLQSALKNMQEMLAVAPEVETYKNLSGAPYYQTTIEGKAFDVYELPIGSVRVVYAKGTKGILACGAINVMALQNFGIAAAKVRPVGSRSVRHLKDLLDGEVVEANDRAKMLGVREGTYGREAIQSL
jgi:uncharacterized protein YunC (DUF1805 family)/quinol monooxygenase YgiN